MKSPRGGRGQKWALVKRDSGFGERLRMLEEALPEQQNNACHHKTEKSAIKQIIKAKVQK